LFVTTGRRSNLDAQTTISTDLQATIADDPDVDRIDAVSILSLLYRDRLIVVAANDWSVLLARGKFVFKAPADGRAAMEAALGRDEVIVSESFALRFGAGVGSQVILQTPHGPSGFRVAAVYYDYSTDRGVVLMDRRTFTRFYGPARPTSLAVYLRKGSTAKVVRDRLLASFGPEHRVFIHTNVSLRTEVLRIFDATFAITYGLEAIAILVAILGMAGTLITQVIERRRELVMLRLIGAEARQVRRMVMIESGLLGIASQTVGVPLGCALSLVLIDVINVQSFGWTIQLHVPAMFLAQVMAVLLLATTLAGAYPARTAAGVSLVHGGTEE
jgi:putative ABC transport system permease protein